MVIKESFPGTQECGEAVYWKDRVGNYVVAWKSGACLHSAYLQTEREIVEFIESVFEIDFATSGYTIGDLRDTMEQYEEEWFDIQPGMTDLSSYTRCGFESLYIGSFDAIYEYENKEGTQFVEYIGDVPKEYRPYMDQHKKKYWVRTNDCQERTYDGPHDTLLEAVQAAVEKWF